MTRSRDGRRPAALRPRAARRPRRPALPLRRAQHVRARRSGVRELPHLRRLRQPRVGPRRPDGRDGSERQPVPRRRPERPVPSDEGADDDAEPARHGRRRPDALARRPQRRHLRRRPALDEDLAFKEFNPAFVGLLGRSTQLLPAEMQAFTDFILTRPLSAEPDPRARQRRRRPRRRRARTSSLTGRPTAALITCVFCHRLPLGTDGLSSFEGEPQEFKIAHLRNLYQKVGMFGLPRRSRAAGSSRPARRRPGPRLRLPARRRRSLRPCHRTSCGSIASTSAAASHIDDRAAEPRGVHARLRHRPPAGRRPAGLGDADDVQHADRRSTASTC